MCIDVNKTHPVESVRSSGLYVSKVYTLFWFHGSLLGTSVPPYTVEVCLSPGPNPLLKKRRLVKILFCYNLLRRNKLLDDTYASLMYNK